MAFKYNRCFSLYTKVNSAMCNSMGEFWGHYPEWNKPVTERCIQLSSYIQGIKNGGCQCPEWEGSGVLLTNGQSFS